MRSGWQVQQPSKNRRRLVGLLATLAVSACGLTTQNSDEPPATAGALNASGTSNQAVGASNGTTPNGTAAFGGRGGSPGAVAGSGPTTSGGISGEMLGGAPSSVSAGAPSAGGVPSVGGAFPEGGAAGSNCATFEEAWQSRDCTAVLDTEVTCSAVCSAARQSCVDKCDSRFAECTATCVGIDCNPCKQSSLQCRLVCARNAAACTAPCVKAGSTCRRLLTDYPNCAEP